ncbi:MAG: alanine racemase, partial [Planktomarina sp.]
GRLSINLSGIAENWSALDQMSATHVETAAVVKADGYGLGSDRVAATLARAGATTFFVAASEEGSAVRGAVGADATVCVFSGHMAGDTDMIHDLNLVPMLNSIDQITRHLEALPQFPFGVQLDSGMNRLGVEPSEWYAVRDIVMQQNPVLLMSHLACADEPDHPMNAQQLQTFRAMTDGCDAPRSLAATGGTLLGPEYHFDMVRPGVGLYGGMPYADAMPVVHLSLPIIQVRDVEIGEAVGYGGSWIADKPSKIATVAAGYADGLLRAQSNIGNLWFGDTPCPIAGRVSMDMIGVDITSLDHIPSHLDILSPYQGVDQLADAASTIGYEILTSLGNRYHRRYITA